ncbi:MAG: SEL1-like repeat protein [Desulfuromonadales bacterium]|nr:SEL1-like repeat protein [Desulfuromonadales bacterium]
MDQELLKKAEAGDAEAQYNLGILYYNGEGVIRDRQKGCDLIRASAEQWYKPAIEVYNKHCAK